jgi:hypothetical protein
LGTAKFLSALLNKPFASAPVKAVRTPFNLTVSR